MFIIKNIYTKYISSNEDIKNLNKYKWNKQYIKENLKRHSDYFDNIYKDINPNVKIDLNQRIAILTDDDFNLIIAGAGTGKTTTMICKIKYLIDKLGVLPSEILAISFAKKNVIELDEKLNGVLKLGVNVSTFHKLGLDIISDNGKKNIINKKIKNKIINSYFSEVLYNDQVKLKKMVEFLSMYFQIGEGMDNFLNLEDFFYNLNKESSSDKEFFRIDTKKGNETMKGEFVLNSVELYIANFLFYRGITYEYGYNIIKKENKLCNKKSSFVLYYRKLLGYIYYDDSFKKLYLNNKEISLVDLQSSLESFGFQCEVISEDTMYNYIMQKNNNYFNKYTDIVMNFMEKMKIFDLTINDIILKMRNQGMRTKLFLETFIPFYYYYEEAVKKENLMDFDDMVIEARKNIIDSGEVKFNYKYIIIDEYQDISMQRFLLIKSIVNIIGSKIIAVGDDFQAIYGFAGSDVRLFTDFIEVWGSGVLLHINNTYRNCQELIDIATKFVCKDKSLIKKKLLSTKRMNNCLEIYSYTNNKIELIIFLISRLEGSILLLGRYNNDINELLISKRFFMKNGQIICQDVVNKNIFFTSVHKSKGLEFDNVILINGMGGIYGFPSKICNDSIFNIFANPSNIMEERRLFYVALTRTKNKIYIIVDKNNVSEFVKELKMPIKSIKF